MPLAHKWLGFEDAELALRLDGTFANNKTKNSHIKENL